MWGVVGESVTENNTVENIEKLFKTAKENDIQVFISPHYYFPHDHGWHFEGALEAVMHHAGMFDRKDPLSVEGFEGSEPEDFETITRRYVAANPMSRPGLANKLHAIADFAKILLTPAPNLSAYDSAQNQPLLRAPEYGLDNQAWRETHAVTNAFGAGSAFNEGHIQLPTRARGAVAFNEGHIQLPTPA